MAPISDRVAVRRLALHIFHREPSTGPGAVLDHDRLARMSASFGPTMRANRSVPPPAAKPSTKWIGLFG